MELGSVSNLDSWNKFQSYSQNDGLNVALRLPNLGTYVKRVHDDDRDYMMPLLSHSVFRPVVWYEPYMTAILLYTIKTLIIDCNRYDAGCFQPIEYEVLEVEYDTSGLDPATYTPNLVDSVVIDNNSDVPINRRGQSVLPSCGQTSCLPFPWNIIKKNKNNISCRVKQPFFY